MSGSAGQRLVPIEGRWRRSPPWLSFFAGGFSGPSDNYANGQDATSADEGDFSQSFTQHASLALAQINNAISQVSSITNSGSALIISGNLRLNTKLAKVVGHLRDAALDQELVEHHQQVEIKVLQIHAIHIH